MEDHGILTFTIFVRGRGWGCGIGQYTNGVGYLGAKEWKGNGSAIVAMMKIMDTVGVSKWEDLIGKYTAVNSVIPEGSMFYNQTVIEEKDLKNSSNKKVKNDKGWIYLPRLLEESRGHRGYAI